MQLHSLKFVLYHGSYCEVKEPNVQREKILGVTLSQFFQEGNSENLTEKQKEVLGIWNDLNANEQETVMSMLCGLRK